MNDKGKYKHSNMQVSSYNYTHHKVDMICPQNIYTNERIWWKLHYIFYINNEWCAPIISIEIFFKFKKVMDVFFFPFWRRKGVMLSMSRVYFESYYSMSRNSPFPPSSVPQEGYWSRDSSIIIVFDQFVSWLSKQGLKVHQWLYRGKLLKNQPVEHENHEDTDCH